MAINGTDLINEPWNTTFSPFTDLFEKMVGSGSLFYLFPIAFIGVALYMKTKDVAVVSMYLLVTGALFSSGGIFIGAIEMATMFTLVAAIGLVGLFISLLLKR